MTVVKNDVCIGCGVCVPLCPINNLRMVWKNGKFEALHNSEECLSKCVACFKVCPFDDSSRNEDSLSRDLYADIEGISFDPDCGYYLKNYVGHAPELKKRMKSASGGLTTYLLETLLNSGKVNYVATVAKVTGSETLFKYKMCSTIDEINDCNGSAYYPVEISSMLEDILNIDGRYAVVALPCVSKAIRNAMLTNSVLKTKIKFIIGLVCSQTKTDFFSRYLAKKQKIESLTAINFRTKSENTPTSNYKVKMEGSDGTENYINFTDFSMDWSDRYFTPNACNFCDDVFAETADIAMMDAWLPIYSKSVEGYNLILNRNVELEEILKSVGNMKEIDIDGIKNSQRLATISKRHDISARILRANKKKEFVPKKREHLLNNAVFERRFVASFTYDISRISQRYWQESGGNLTTFNRLMRNSRFEMFVRRQIYRFFTILKQIKGQR